MHTWSAVLKIFSWVVVALMVVAMLFAAYISLTHWSGISV